jgi:hypothetical protein
MKFSQGLMVLVGCALVLGCEVTESPLCSSNDTRQAMEPGTKLSKGDLKVACECGAVANEHSDCCDGCPFGDAIVCRSSTVKDPLTGFGIDTCAGHTPEEVPDPRCSVLDANVIVTLNYAPNYQGNGLVGAAPFKWEWFNPQPVDVPPSQVLVDSRDLQEPVQLFAETLDGNDDADAPTGWTQTLQPCDHPEAEATLTLNEPTYWDVTLKNLPGVMPFTQVALSEPFGE